MDRGAWQAAVHGLKELDTSEQLTHFVTHQHLMLCCHYLPLSVSLSFSFFHAGYFLS